MANAQAMLKKALRESGCVSFLEDDAAEALDRIERARPEAFALLAQDARESMRDSLLPQAAPGVEDFGRSMPQYSVLNLGLLPVRSYRMELFSPLYYKGSDGACLPNYDGQRFTVEGHEESFVEGFREGYSRVLDAREEA